MSAYCMYVFLEEHAVSKGIGILLQDGLTLPVTGDRTFDRHRCLYVHPSMREASTILYFTFHISLQDSILDEIPHPILPMLPVSLYRLDHLTHTHRHTHT